MNRPFIEDDDRIRVKELYKLEDEARANGYKLIAGVDEAGRGSLVGPLTVAAVILGGINRIAKLASRVVPTMVILYLLLVVVIMVLNYDRLPGVFASMPGGSIIAILFFLSLLLAAVTSAISMLEVIVRYFIEEWKLSRNGAVIVSMVLIILLGCVCSLSQGTLSGITILGNNIFDFFDVISSDVLITVGSLVMVLFAGWRIKKAGFLDELTGHDTSHTPRWIFTFVWFMVRWVAPIVIIVIMLSNFLL